MKTKTLILAALAAVVLAGCEKTVYHRPAFPEEYQDFLPYQEGDSLIFVCGQEEMAFEVLYKTGETATTTDLPGNYKPELGFVTKLTPQMYEMVGYFALLDSTFSDMYCYLTFHEYNEMYYDLGLNSNPFVSSQFEKQVDKDTTSFIVFQDPEAGDFLYSQGDSVKCTIQVTEMVWKRGVGVVSFYDALHDRRWKLKN